MIFSKIVMVRGKKSVSEDWGEFEFLGFPSPGDRIMVKKDGTENYATVLAVHHYPCIFGSGDKPRAEVVAQWTGSGPRMR